VKKGGDVLPENTETSWLQERKLANRIPQPLSGIINLAIILVISEICWYFLFSPAGPVSLYTPNVGLSLVITMLMVIHWGMDAFDFWPFSRDFLKRAHPLAKGFILLLFYTAVGVFVMFGIYYNFIGRFGAIFFSGPRLIASGGLGQYSQTAVENGCYAQIMMNTCIIFFTILWLTGFHYAPWQKCGRLSRSFAVWIMGLLLGLIAFVFLFFPHIAYMFYPPQTFMAVEPWWPRWAMTQSSLFHFGWIVPALVLLYWTNMLWEGRPFSLIKTVWLRGVVTAVSVTVAGIILMFIANSIMNWYFGSEAIEGGMATEQPAWRWNHVAEMAMFMNAGAAILFYYFDNWPVRLSLPVRAVVRTVIAIAGGLLISWLYYTIGPALLGTVPGLGQENDTSLAWTVMFLILVITHGFFVDGYPCKRRAT
jgi:AAT family amino acid transporter